jgi:hypothetical protein
MKTLPTEILRTIASFTETFLFFNGQFLDISFLLQLKQPANIRKREFNPFQLGVTFRFVQYYKIFLPITSAKSYVLSHYISDVAKNFVSFSCELHENDSIVNHLWSAWSIVRLKRSRH